MKSISYPIPIFANTSLTAIILVAHGALLALLPMALVHSLWWALVIPAFAWMHITHWALIHEAIHKLLHPDNRVNETMGRILCILMGASLPLLRFGHTMHHQFNRDWHHEFVEKPSIAARFNYYSHLFLGLYGSEVLSNFLLAILPSKAALKLAHSIVFNCRAERTAIGERFFYIRGNIHALRFDTALTVIFYAVAFWHFGAYWPVLASFFLIRAIVISFLDNIYHYATPIDNSKAGKELILSPLYSVIMLHGNYHETHHLNAQVPWTSLADVHRSQNRTFTGKFEEHAIQQFHGPLTA